MKKLTVKDVNMTPPGRLAITLNQRKDKIDRLEIIISLMDVRLKENIKKIAGQAADIEKLKDSIRVFESEQKEYTKTTIRLNKRNKEKAAEIENQRNYIIVLESEKRDDRR